jgi:hypothetical protein
LKTLEDEFVICDSEGRVTVTKDVPAYTASTPSRSRWTIVNIPKHKRGASTSWSTAVDSSDGDLIGDDLDPNALVGGVKVFDLIAIKSWTGGLL